MFKEPANNPQIMHTRVLRSMLESGFVQAEDGKLHYEANGTGPALVLIHAGFLDRRMWDQQFQLFSKHYRVIRYDVRGYGKSDRPETNFSDYKDLHTLLSHLGIGSTHIIGVSNGGRIALDFAVEYPQMVRSLVLVGTGVKGREILGPEEEKAWDEFDVEMKPQEEAVKENRLAEAAEMDVNVWASAQTPESRNRILEIAIDNSHTQKENPGKLQVSPQPPAYKRLSEIRAPTLVIIGDRDVRGMRYIADDVHSKIEGSKILVIPGADHIVNMSRPDEFNRAVLEFLNSSGTF